jgi:hypothetical protein
MKWHTNWKEQDLNICSQELDQLVASQLESGHRLDKQK